ncbi:hypothetical protein MLP_45840 [Microlunatus phosphovorus NM-1]|uniref:Transposase n=1 Tax=Microlunatus phosphovorus (strain ATCC 700054 / DSM 10555 / JCM 9379 / NBRC 101784 / NCIMB 13414 / VKM Ac-1990 / NM-1) TaxID=1032480 RepID=F5XE50_MICPN|nr:hypothetical protein [Microlunatus phosphovorus]BAK37598.1 hypothetical protein MLP_45840 [Microlunatus phosphovorus NM-1]
MASATSPGPPTSITGSTNSAEQQYQALDYRYHPALRVSSIAWLTRGNRRLRYRGVEKNNAWLHHRLVGRAVS